MRELFLEQLRVIASHPYENVGDDGCPLVGGTADGEVIPDYETIFVKGKNIASRPGFYTAFFNLLEKKIEKWNI